MVSFGTGWHPHGGMPLGSTWPLEREYGYVSLPALLQWFDIGDEMKAVAGSVVQRCLREIHTI